MTATINAGQHNRTLSPCALSLRALSKKSGEARGRLELGGLTVEVHQSSDSVSAIIRRKGKEALALRAIYSALPFDCSVKQSSEGEELRLEVESDAGIYLDIAEVWRRGSVISSWLLDLCAAALARDEMLALRACVRLG